MDTKFQVLSLCFVFFLKQIRDHTQTLVPSSPAASIILDAYERWGEGVGTKCIYLDELVALQIEMCHLGKESVG
jgi:hypothetical protein